ncbi:hypothetical protein ACTXIV_03110 [Psychrobacter celer]|uniref:hypothetical protein n=1 Tax=Psychrobacter celer TaxID=306572 RepID=UPI003FCF9EBC
MKIAALLTIIPLSLMSVSAVAGMGQDSGYTSCVVVDSISKKKAVNIDCTYEGTVGASMSYAIENFDYKLSTGKKYSTVDDSTFDFDANGKVKNLESTVMLNQKPAQIKNLIRNSYKEISDSDIEKRYETSPVDLSDLLRCFIPDAKKDTAFCIPYYEEDEEGMA